MSTISFLVPTIGRASLKRTLASIECREGDEILVVGAYTEEYHPYARHIPCDPGGDWGHKERNYATKFARGKFIAHIDDDDVYAPGTRDLMADAITENPDGPTLFRMRYPNGITLWGERKVRCGNVGTPMFLIPNVPEKLGTWGSFVGGDCHFLETSEWMPDEYAWRPEVIALLGHNT